MKYDGYGRFQVAKGTVRALVVTVGLLGFAILPTQSAEAALINGSLTVTINPEAARAAGAQWQVDGGSFHKSGEKVSGIAMGWHTVSFKPVNGWTAPASQSKYVWGFLTNSIKVNYTAVPQTGSLQVNLSPASAISAGAQWQVDGGAYQNSGATVTGLATGSHTLTFKTVSNHTTPASQTATVSANTLTTAVATYVAIPQTGSLQVNLSPAGAVSAGAQWQVDGGAYQNSGATVTGLSTGSHTVKFKTVSNYTTPASLTVNIMASALTTAAGAYVAIPQTGSLQVNISPAGAVSAGARWQVDGGVPQNSGATVGSLSTGSHMVTFTSATGYTTPASQSVTVAANALTVSTASYAAIPTTGSLQVTLLPAGAVTAGAQWQVDGGAFAASGAMVTGLSEGTHTVAFKTVTGWVTPANQTATITAGQTATLSATYVAAPNTSHYGRFSTYEGSKTCRVCHPQETADVHGSLHYQWKGSTPYVENMTEGGKLGAINDFCTYADISWISQLTNVAGSKVDGGCSQCHVGRGQRPLPEATEAQLDNIDCLVCHSENYKRKVEMVGTSLAFVPAPEKMKVSLIEGITDIKLPTNGSCLNCHA